MATNSGLALSEHPPHTSLDAPHSIYDAMHVPRVYARNQPFGQQAAFSMFYPNGLPVTYQMEHGKESGGAPQYYVENHLPARFYNYPPPLAPAKFSTFNGHGPFRAIGEVLPDRRVHLWNKDEIQSVCNSLRRVFKADLKRLQRPTRWDHLWEFFDAYDLYHYGALNLWNVTNTLYDENCIIAQGCNAEMALEMGYFVDKWVKNPQNREQLKQWSELDGPLWSVLSAHDWKEIRNLEDEDASLLKSALLYRRDMLLAGDDPQHRKPSTDLMTACRSGNLVNWLGEPPRHPSGRNASLITLAIADAQILGPNGMPSPPPSEPVHGSPNGMNAAAPCFVQHGHHNHHARRPGAAQEALAGNSAAVQALQKSADAATTKRDTVVAGNGVVIAMGSSRPPPGWEKGTAETTAVKAVAETPTEEPTPKTDADPGQPKDGQEARKANSPDVNVVEPQANCNEDVALAVKEPRATASSPDLCSTGETNKGPNEGVLPIESEQEKMPKSKAEKDSGQPRRDFDIANDDKKGCAAVTHPQMGSASESLSA